MRKADNPMARSGRNLAAVILLSAFTSLMAACQSGILFEESNADPHPPSIANLVYAPQSIMTGGTVRGSFTYIDAGADIETVSMRDTSGANAAAPTPVMAQVPMSTLAPLSLQRWVFLSGSPLEQATS